jgi:hypothetical protein
MKQLPGLDYDIRSPKFNVKRPERKTDDEILADVGKKSHSDDWQRHSQGVGGCPKDFEASRSRQLRLGGNESSMPTMFETDSTWQENATARQHWI